MPFEEFKKQLIRCRVLFLPISNSNKIIKTAPIKIINYFLYLALFMYLSITSKTLVDCPTPFSTAIKFICDAIIGNQ